MRNYAIRGLYLSPYQTYTAATISAFQHNIGVDKEHIEHEAVVRVVVTESTSLTGLVHSNFRDGNPSTNANFWGVVTSLSSRTGGNLIQVTAPLDISASGCVAKTAANFRVAFRAKRAF